MRITIPLHRRGPALWPEVFSLDLLLRRLRELGSALFATVYQGEPTPERGSLFQREWFADYTTPPRLLQVAQAWDTALKSGQEHDYSCGITGGYGEDGRVYLLDCWRGQVDSPALLRAMTEQAARWRPRWLLLEDAAAGPVLLPQLRPRLRGCRVMAVKPHKDKRARAQGMAPMVEAGEVCLPHTAPWREALLDELQRFPTGAHDDQVDALVYLLAHFDTHRPKPIPLTRPDGW